MHFLSKLSVAAIAVLAATSDARAHRHGLVRRHGGEDHGAAAVESPAPAASPAADVPVDQYVEDTAAVSTPVDSYVSESSASEASPLETVEYYTGMHVSNSTTAASATVAPSSSADGAAGASSTSTMALSTGHEEPLVTRVVYSTSVATITDCGETVTECAAGSTVLVTSVVAVSTTICPKSEAEASGYGPTDSPVPSVSVPIGTGVSTDASPVPTGEVEYSTEIKDVTLTYTQGSGSSTSVVTTTVRVTQTLTQTKTAVVTRATSSADGAVVDATSSADGAVVDATPVPTAAEEMSTYEYTSTETQYITLSAVPTNYGGDQSNVVAEEVVAENVSGGDQTGVVAEETPADASNVSGQEDTPSQGESGTDSSNVSGTTDNTGSSNVGTEGEAPVCPAPTTVTVTSALTVTVTATPTANPVAESLSAQPTPSSAYYGNGTESQPCTKGCVASTGFITLVSTYPASTASPVSTEAPVSTDASSIPAPEEYYVEDVAASSAAPESAETPVPAPEEYYVDENQASTAAGAGSEPIETPAPAPSTEESPAEGSTGHEGHVMPDAYRRF